MPKALDARAVIACSSSKWLQPIGAPDEVQHACKKQVRTLTLNLKGVKGPLGWVLNARCDGYPILAFVPRQVCAFNQQIWRQVHWLRPRCKCLQENVILPMVRAAALEQQSVRQDALHPTLGMLDDPSSLQALLASMLANVRTPSIPFQTVVEPCSRTIPLF